MQNIAAGYLPERTHKGVLREFNVRFGQRGRPNLDFSFIEIAGEDIRSIVPTAEHKQPRLHDHLERYLRQGGVNKRFLFVSDASRNRLGQGRVRGRRPIRYADSLFVERHGSRSQELEHACSSPRSGMSCRTNTSRTGSTFKPTFRRLDRRSRRRRGSTHRICRLASARRRGEARERRSGLRD